MTPLATDNLASLIRKKHQVLVQLRDIGLKQQALSEESTASALLQLMGAKQHLISALELVERNLRPYHAEDPNSRVWRTEADRKNCAQQAEACTTLLAEVMELEKQQEQRMISRRNEVADQLIQAGATRDAAGAYHRNSKPQSHASNSTIPTPFATETLGELPTSGLDLTSEIS